MEGKNVIQLPQKIKKFSKNMPKIMNKKFIAAAGALSLAATFFTVTTVLAAAANSANVNATVTVQNISLTVSTDGVIPYGTLGQNSTANTCSTAPNLNDAQTIQNNGNVPEDFAIAGVDTVSWTVETTAGTDQYVHSYKNGACTTTFTGDGTLDTTPASFASNIAATSTATLNLQINTPNPSTVFTEQAPNVVLTASIHT
jgi:hypothetical protein